MAEYGKSFWQRAAYCGIMNHIVAEKLISELIRVPFLLLIQWIPPHCLDMLRKSDSLPEYPTEQSLSHQYEPASGLKQLPRIASRPRPDYGENRRWRA